MNKIPVAGAASMRPIETAFDAASAVESEYISLDSIARALDRELEMIESDMPNESDPGCLAISFSARFPDYLAALQIFTDALCVRVAALSEISDALYDYAKEKKKEETKHAEN